MLISAKYTPKFYAQHATFFLWFSTDFCWCKNFTFNFQLTLSVEWRLLTNEKEFTMDYQEFFRGFYSIFANLSSFSLRILAEVNQPYVLAQLYPSLSEKKLQLKALLCCYQQRSRIKVEGKMKFVSFATTCRINAWLIKTDYSPCCKNNGQ